MRIIWKRDDGLAEYNGKIIPITCDVRNELNGRRLLSEKPCYNLEADGKKGPPVMPRPFPKGIWIVVGVFPRKDPYLAPQFISTDAKDLVDEWTEVDGHYGEKTGRQVWSYGYGLHNSRSATTLGCGRIGGTLDGETEFSTKERKELAAAIMEEWRVGRGVILEVL